MTPLTRFPSPTWAGKRFSQPDPSPLFDTQENELRFYFSHSYHLVCNDPADVAATATYGYEFTAAVHRDNILGTQFHPEKSHVFGLEVFRRFTRLGAP